MSVFIHDLVGRAGIEPATRGLLTTLAFASRSSKRCSLDCLITLGVIRLGVRRTVSEDS